VFSRCALTKARVGRNPNKPETDVVIPARATVKFKPGKIMRQRVLLRTEQLSKSPTRPTPREKNSHLARCLTRCFP